MERVAHKTIKIITDKKTGAGENFLVLRMNLVKSCHVFDLIMKTYGKSLISIATRIYLNAEGKKGEARLRYSEVEEALNVYVENSPGMTLSVFQEILDPELIKYKDKPLDLSDIFTKFGLKFVFLLAFEVIKFNYEDFFFSK